MEQNNKKGELTELDKRIIEAPPSVRKIRREITKETQRRVKEQVVDEINNITMKELLGNMIYPSSVLICSKKFGGKSNVIRNIYNKNNFDNVFIVSRSHNTGNLDVLATDDENLIQSVDDKFIEALLEFQEENPDSQMLIIFDDFIEGQKTLHHVKKIIEIATSGRNKNISLCISTQNLSSVPPELRKNSEYIFIGKNLYKSAKYIADEYATCNLPPRELARYITELSSTDRHDFLIYDDRKAKWKLLPQEEIKVYIK